MKYTTEEVREEVNSFAGYCHTHHGIGSELMAIASAYADLLERIEADESAVPVAFRFLGPDGEAVTEWEDAPITDKKFPDLCQSIESVQYAYLHPPAQAAQVDLRNSLLRGKAQNEEPRVRHSCNIGVGCEETGICYAEANGQPEQCGRPTAEPMAQPTDSGRSYATSWTDEEKARAFEWLRAAATADGAPMEAGVALDTWHALAAQGRGEPVAWQYQRLTDEGWGIWWGLEADQLETVRRRTDCEVRALYTAPPIDAPDSKR